MKKRDGFTLIEVLTSLSILLLFASTFFPWFFQIYNERVAIDQKMFADELNYRLVQDQLAGEYLPEEGTTTDNRGTVYTWQYKQTGGQTAEICISWEGRNGRMYESCQAAYSPR
ncbi:type II secretion system protein [Texcoconibacillus texcoconensis]|uniref:Prepilin-type N-terminal cleavage/methylation domain-containing protein n=1 Tax=Texcoconibacillus texcoconensis TaxID=1095777 RepID=A0A840QP03_9BACI|nr:type II secretion system protein [Texcoconibacillus texcoconensis]MBB5173105.1 prepilin-type N-terminal cleavage/methylation domain-containing protein [Texcoconibacillus texcoconensis]